jgi:hypothetical protein
MHIYSIGMEVYQNSCTIKAYWFFLCNMFFKKIDSYGILVLFCFVQNLA